jgi:hypothetical protein
LKQVYNALLEEQKYTEFDCEDYYNFKKKKETGVTFGRQNSMKSPGNSPRRSQSSSFSRNSGSHSPKSRMNDTFNNTKVSFASRLSPKGSEKSSIIVTAAEEEQPATPKMGRLMAALLRMA